MNDTFIGFIKSKMVDGKIELTKEELAMVLYQFAEVTLKAKKIMDGAFGQVPKEVLMKSIKDALDEQL